jgi:hypothetical protein
VACGLFALLPGNDRVFSATNFQFVTVGIFEEAGVIPAAITATEFRAFQIFRADFAHEPSEPVDFVAALSPKGDSRAVGLMPSTLREAKKCFRFVSAGSVEDSPPSARAIAGKPERRQQLSVELVRAFQITYAQVDMVEVPRLFHFLKAFPRARRTTSFNPDEGSGN